MDFFASQDQARKKTGVLVVYFMLAVLGIIVSLYVVAVLLHGYFLAERAKGAPPVFDWGNLSLLLGVGLGTLIVVGAASLAKIAALNSGGGAVARSLGGRKVEPFTDNHYERRLLNVVEEMALASGTRIPEVYVLPDEGINAFAAGFTADDAAVAVTRGCMDKLSRDELQGVVAHEFSHILNGDMRLNIRLMGVLFGILILAVIGQGILHAFRGVRVSGGRRSSKDSGGGAIVAIFLFALALYCIGYIGVFFGRLIQSAVSRQREFLADAAAVQFTRNPLGIAGALKRIGGSMNGSLIENSHSQEAAHFFFANALKSKFGGMLATHPPLEDRIYRIDPGWDGKFVYQQAKKEKPPTLPADKAVKRRSLNPQELLLAVGTLEASALEEARELRESIDADFGLQIRGPLEARALVFAMVLDPEEEPRQKQLAYLEAEGGLDLAEKVRLMRERLSKRERRDYLPILELALPAIAQMEPERKQLFQQRLNELIKADGKLSPLEFVLGRMVNHHLNVKGKKRQPGSYVFSYNVMIEPLSQVLSAVIRLSVTNEVEAERCVHKARQRFIPAVRERIELLPADKLGLTVLNEALDTLGTAAYAIRKSLLEACGEAIAFDGKTSVREAEFFRVISLALDCPMPILPRDRG